MGAILFCTLPPAAVIERAKSLFRKVEEQTLDIEGQELIERAATLQAQAILVSVRHKMDAALIRQLPDSLKVIATMSVGTDHIDVPAAHARGVVVTNTPDVLTECTADLGLMLLLNACRRGAESLQIMQAGWRRTFGLADNLGLKVSGKTLGILGMGRIGQALADRARGFGMTIIYCNTKPLPPELAKGATYFKDFKQMLPHCQILSLNAPGTKETRHIMNDKTFGLLPDHAVFVNVARGSMVDEAALFRALDSKKLFGAGLDVFEEEPNFNLKFLEYPNVFLTPHAGSATLETREAMGFRALDNVVAVLEGKPVPDLVLK